MDKFSNLMQLANFPQYGGFPQAQGGPMMPWQQGMFPPASGGPSPYMGGQQQYMGGPLGGGQGGPVLPNSFMRQAPFGNGGYGNFGGMNNLMMMHQLSGGSGYGGY